MRVVLADKDPYDLEAMRSELASQEIDVFTARDGREVLRLAAERRPDVIIASASLGQMGGFAISRDLKMHADVPGAEPAPKVVILIDREADSWLADWSRCDAWRMKPVDPEELRELVSTK